MFALYSVHFDILYTSQTGAVELVSVGDQDLSSTRVLEFFSFYSFDSDVFAAQVPSNAMAISVKFRFGIFVEKSNGPWGISCRLHNQSAFSSSWACSRLVTCSRKPCVALPFFHFFCVCLPYQNCCCNSTTLVKVITYNLTAIIKLM